MKKVLLTILVALSVAGTGMLFAGQEKVCGVPEEPQKLTLEDIAKRHGISVFNLPGTDKRLFVHLETLTRLANIAWTIDLFNHDPRQEQKIPFYVRCALVSLMNLKSRGYADAISVLGSGWGTQFLTVPANAETCQTHLLRGLMVTQFAKGLYEVDKLMSSPLMESNSITKKFGIWVA